MVVKFLDTAYISPATEKDETGLRQRRNYREIANTPAGEIIEAAGGPKDWPPLTREQEAIIAGREQDAQEEREFAARIGSEIAARKTLPAT